jgi:hypothetical protein
MFGYSIALAGLIYYKVGAEQAHAAYLKLTADENSTFNRFRRSLWAKIGAGVLIIFVLLAMAHGFSRRNMLDTARVHTGLTGAPDPEMADSRYPETGTSHNEMYNPGKWDDEIDAPSTHYMPDVDETPTIHSLDVVIYISPQAESSTIKFFQDTLSLPAISALMPHVFAYGSENPTFPVQRQHQAISSSSVAYLEYISTHYDTLPQHTIFLHTDMIDSHNLSFVTSRFSSRTGVAELTLNGYAECTCMDCLDTEHTPLTRTDELYALTNRNICSPSEKLLVGSIQG